MVYAFILLFAWPGAIIPICWILRMGWEERAFSPWLMLAGVIAHVINIVLLTIYMPILVLVYFGLVLLAILLNPLLGRSSNNRQEVRLAEEDIAKYSRRLTRHPENAALHTAIADAYVTCRRYDEAIASYQRAIELDPEHAHLETAKIHYAQIRKTQAEERRKQNPWLKRLRKQR